MASTTTKFVENTTKFVATSAKLVEGVVDFRELRSHCLAAYPPGSPVRELAGTLSDELPRAEAGAILEALARLIVRNRPGDGA